MGGALWERGTVPETLLAIVSEDRDLTLRRIFAERDEPEGLAAVLRKALALTPEARFDSALEFADVLEGIMARTNARASQLEVGRFLRGLYRNAPDLPPEPRERPATLNLQAVPESPYDDTDPTLIEIELDLFPNSTQSDRNQASTQPAGAAVVMIDAPMTDPNRSSFANVPPGAASVTRSLRAVPTLKTSEGRRASSASGARTAAAVTPSGWEEQPSLVPVRVPDGLRGSPSRAHGWRWMKTPERFNTLRGLLIGVLVGAALATAACLWALSLS